MMQYFNKNDKKLQKIADFFKVFKIDFSFLLLLCLAFLLDEMKLYFYHVIFVVLHEMSHFVVSKKLGYLPKKIHLTFFGASLEGDDDFVLDDEIKIVLAGPIFNFLVVIFCYLMFWFKPESYIFLSDILVANWSILLFNFLPIFPLDFGRFLLVVFNKKYERRDALLKVKKISSWFVCFMFCVFLISFFFSFNFTLGFVCVNLASLLMKSSTDTSYKRSLFVDKKFQKLKKGLIERNVYVDENCPNFKLYKFIDDYHFFNFIFLSKDSKEVRRISEIELYKQDNMIEWLILLQNAKCLSLLCCIAIFIYLYKNTLTKWAWSVKLLACHMQKVFFCCEKILSHDRFMHLRSETGERRIN